MMHACMMYLYSSEYSSSHHHILHGFVMSRKQSLCPQASPVLQTLRLMTTSASNCLWALWFGASSVSLVHAWLCLPAYGLGRPLCPLRMRWCACQRVAWGVLCFPCACVAVPVSVWLLWVLFSRVT